MQRINRWPSFLSLTVLIAGLAIPSLAISPGSVSAQDVVPRSPTTVPRVFFDCRGRECDNTYYRTEINWVAWVRDRRDANVHVIMTSQNTGAGGREYQLDFLGRGVYQDYETRSLYQSLPTDTQRERLDGVALTLGLGLATFATESGYRNVVQLAGLAPVGEVNANLDTRPAGILSPGDVEDPWKLWVFRVRASGQLNTESKQESRELRTSLNASRVTPTWKQSYNANYRNNRQEFDLNDGSRFVDNRYDWGFFARVVYSVAEHWSIGVRSNVGRNTRNNQSLWGQFNPAIEYSFFPYQEATRRSMTAFYEIGPVYRRYFEETLLGKEEELRAEQALTLQFSQRQPWGNASIRLTGSAYLHDLKQNNVSLRGNLSFRIMRGLDLNVGASYSRIRDQVFLAGGDLTDAERLLELQTQQTDSRASLNFGFSYQFGSIFNNVVNNRFPRGGGGGNF
ncbi:MAG: hypothetical protein IIC36_14065 [Gemmatimonadetes bacterium]|nr:hypothetical protein [Gemmatimonadota bacterium]